MKLISLFILAITLVLLSACVSTSNSYTTNVQDITNFEENSYIYSLPRTCFVIECRAVRSIFIAGPYANKAKELLNIEGAKESDDISWHIQNIKISSLLETDPEYYYSIRNISAQTVQNSIQHLKENKLIVCSHSNHTEPDSHFINSQSEFPTYQSSIDLNTLRYEAFSSIPYIKKHLSKNEKENPEKLAADDIMKLRKIVRQVFKSENDLYPDGLAVKEGVKIFAEMEAEFLSLFIGKTFTDTITQHFYFYPESKQKLQRKTLFRFSEEVGFIESKFSGGKAVDIEITDLGNSKYLDHLFLTNNSPSQKNLLFYRIPDNAEIKIMYGSIPIAKIQKPVYQLGAVVPFYLKK